MTQDLTNYYSKVGYLRASGLNEEQAHAKAEEVMENILLDALAEEAGAEIKTRTYEDAGLVVEVEGSKFQITIVKA